MNYVTLLLTAFITFSSPTLADTATTVATVPLFVATSDAFDGQMQVNLAVDADGNATGLAYTQNGKDTTLPLSSLDTGIVLYQTSGKNVAVLTGKSFSGATGGALTLTYLHDGLNDDYETFDFALGRQGQSWDAYVTNANGVPRTFITMSLPAKKLLGKVIGIDSISVK